MIKSPLRYPGGKSRAVRFLASYLPDFSELREPFLGGGSFSIYCLQQYADSKFLASDLNYEVYCFWEALKRSPEILVENIHRIKDRYSVGKTLFNDILKRRNGTLSELERATDFFILNRITFSGVVDSGGYSDASYQKRFTESSIHRLETLAPLLEKIDFHCEDYQFALEKEGKDVLIYLDPPYYTATKSKLYGKKGILHQNFDHELLCAKLSNCEHRWLMTYDDSPKIRELYGGFNVKEFQLSYGMNNYKKKFAPKGNEILISNYPLRQVNSGRSQVHQLS